jgi:acyl carrier protein phosphodiesterase
MNYLAHLVLGGTDSDVRLGNFIGDSVKGNQLKRYPEGVAKGIRFHRWVDYFADGHPIARKARAALRPRLDRLAPVGVDMLYDHFLAKNFSRCCPDLPSLHHYAQHVMLDLEGRKMEMPARSQRFFEGMRRHQWLVGYATQSGIEEVCRAMDQRIAIRLGVPSNLAHVIDAAQAFGWSELEDQFFLFWEEFRRKAILAHEHPRDTFSMEVFSAEK